MLEAVQPFFFATVIRADDLTGFVSHTKNQPCGRQAAQVGFVAQRRKVFSYVGG